MATSGSAHFLDHISDGFFCLDTEWRIVYLNRPAAKHFGSSVESLLGRILWEAFPLLIGTEVEKTYRRCMQERVAIRKVDSSLIAPTKRLEVRCYPYADGLAVYFLDVTEREASMVALQRSEAHLKLIIEAVPVCASYVDSNYVLKLASNAYEEFLGRPHEEIVGRPVRQVVGESCWRIMGPQLERAMKGEHLSQQAEVLDDGSNNRRVLQTSYIPHRSCDDQVCGVMVVANDITDQKRTEDDLRESEASHRSLFESAGVGNAELEFESGRLLRVNRQLCSLLGYAQHELLGGMTVHDLIHPGDRDQHRNSVATLANGHADVCKFEERYVRMDGEILWVHVTVTLLKNYVDGPVRCLAVVQDISERKRAQQALVLAVEELRQITQVAPVAIFVSRDPLCKQIHGNAMAQRVLEIGSDDNVTYGSSDGSLVDNNDVGRQFRWYSESGSALSAEELPMQQAVLHNIEVRDKVITMLRPDGKRFTIFGSAAPLHDEHGRVRGCVGAMIDVTSRVEIENALRESEERLRLAIRASGMGYWSWSVDSDSCVLDEVCAKMFEVGVDATFSEILGCIVPEDLDGVETQINAAILACHPYRVEFRVRSGDGAPRWISSLGDVVRDHAGRAVRVFGVNLDITERKVSEQLLKDADRRKDEFLATLAHELRNPLAPISNALQLMARMDGDPRQLVRLRGMMERQVEQLKRLIDDLLDVSRISRGKIELRQERLNLTSVIEQAIESVKPFIDAGHHTLSLDLSSTPVEFEGDSGRLIQVFGNLIHNATKYTPPNGTIHVCVGYEEGCAVVRVRDNGIGIPAGMLTSIFDVFTQVNQSLSRAQGGLGIGLTLVKTIVEMHGGRVEARSEGPGCGSEFSVRLPARSSVIRHPSGRPSTVGEVSRVSPSERDVQSSIQEAVSALMPRHRILVVDDLEPSADTLAMMLEALGQDVRVVYDGMAALDVIRDFCPEIVISDIAMPGMDGYSLARQVRQAGEQSPLLVALTGYGQRHDLRRALEAGFHRHLVKPVSLNVLQELLVTVEDGVLKLVL